jgi:hypothetical protein
MNIIYKDLNLVLHLFSVPENSHGSRQELLLRQALIGPLSAPAAACGARV